MLYRLNLKLKLLLAFMVPIIGMIYFATNIGLKNIETKDHLQTIKLYIQDSIYISNLIHEIQKERGLSSGYVGSSSKVFYSELVKQYKDTNNAINNFIHKVSYHNSEFDYKIKNITKNLKIIGDIRKNVSNKQYNLYEVLDSYTPINNSLIDFIRELFFINSNQKIKKMSIAYINLLKAKELSGIERALLSNIFISGKIDYRLYKKFSILYASSNTYLDTYRKLLDKKQLSLYNKLMDDNSINEVEKLRQIAFSTFKKNQLISRIREAAGYGGMIHSFKNFILRGDPQYVMIFNKKYNRIIDLINEYKSISAITKDEITLLNTIQDTFTKYKINLDKVIPQCKICNKRSFLIDKIVKVDDGPALSALNKLSNNIIGADASYWFKMSTKRIDILKQLEDNLFLDMKYAINVKLADIQDQFIINFLLSALIIIFIIVFIMKIMYDINRSIRRLQNGLKSFFYYVTNDINKVVSIHIKGNDEFANMAEELNKGIFRVKNYLDNKVQQEIEQNKEKDKLFFQQSKMASMGEMIGNIAHQWRQPLSVISSAASGLKLYKEHDVLTDEKFNKLTSSIVDSTQYLSQTINDFRDFFKPDKEKQTFFIKDAIDKDITILENSYKVDNITIIKNIDNIKVTTFQNELSQAILNILKNAKDALVQNITDGKLRLIIIDIKNIDSKVLISIQDNALGIPNDIIDKIFEPYFTTKHKSQGTGIGLYMTQEIIVQHMDGSIDVKNQEFQFDNKNYYGANFIIKI